MTSLIEVRGINKAYKNKRILSDISFILQERDIGVILGPSGCGKTTLMRCLAGLEDISSGDILLGNEVITSKKPENRSVVLMFQDPLLFPHMTVLENVMFGLKQKRISKKNRMKRALEMLEKTEMSEHHHKFPNSLSGGQQQRVALARALIMKPALLLLDEPFSSLDQHLKETVRDWMCALLKEEGVTTMIVTHDKEEAMIIGDHLILINDGVIQQQGKPSDVYQSPVNTYVVNTFSDGIQVDEAFYPSRYLSIVPSNKKINNELSIPATIVGHFFKYGLSFYQLEFETFNKKLTLHSRDTFQIGETVLITNEN